MALFDFEARCKHDGPFKMCEGFRFHRGGIVETGDYPAIWVCDHFCGYWLPFDPEKFPDGICYTKVNKGEKELPELQQSGA